MVHATVGGVAQADSDRVTDSGAQHGPGHLAIECPVGEGGVVIKLADDFLGGQLELKMPWCPVADRCGHVLGGAADIGRLAHLFFHGFADDELAFHAGGAMAGNGAEVVEFAVLVGLEEDCSTGVLAAHIVGQYLEIRQGEVVHRAIPVDQGDLHDGVGGDVKGRVELAVNGTANALEAHAGCADGCHEGEIDGRRVGVRLGQIGCIGLRRSGQDHPQQGQPWHDLSH